MKPRVSKTYFGYDITSSVPLYISILFSYIFDFSVCQRRNETLTVMLVSVSADIANTLSAYSEVLRVPLLYLENLNTDEISRQYQFTIQVRKFNAILATVTQVYNWTDAIYLCDSVDGKR